MKFSRKDAIRILKEIDEDCDVGPEDNDNDYDSMSNEQLEAHLCLSGYIHDEDMEGVEDVCESEEETDELKTWQGHLVGFRPPEDPYFEDLGTTEAYDYREAMIYFNRLGENFVCEYGQELQIDNCSVQIYPCKDT